MNDLHVTENIEIAVRLTRPFGAGAGSPLTMMQMTVHVFRWMENSLWAAARSDARAEPAPGYKLCVLGTSEGYTDASETKVYIETRGMVVKESL